jgi:arylsulfatase A-like enzyme
MPLSLGESLVLGVAGALGLGAGETALTLLAGRPGAALYAGSVGHVALGHAALGVLLALIAAASGPWLRRLTPRPAALQTAGLAGVLCGLPLLVSLRDGLPASLSGTARGALALSVLSGALLLAGVLALAAARAAWLPRRSWALRAAAALGAAVAGLVAAAGPRPGLFASPRSDPQRPPIVLISLDTVRADRLELDRHPSPTAPQLSWLAERAVLFEAAFAPEPWTLPSHTSLLTGLHPVVHGVRSVGARLPEAQQTLAERLATRGYRSFAFVSSAPDGFVGAERGLDQGFEAFHHAPHDRLRGLGTSWLRVAGSLAGRDPAGGDALVAHVTDFLSRPPREPFFLFVHLYDAHSDFRTEPYEAPEALVRELSPPFAGRFPPCDAAGRCATRRLEAWNRAVEAGQPAPELFAAAEIAGLLARYDAGLRHLDELVGHVLAALRRQGLFDDALIVVTADHGEEFLEHGRFLHAQLAPELLHVPLLIKLPGGQGAGRRIAAPVATTDVLPTLTAALGLPSEATLDGRSLLPLLEASAPEASERELHFALADVRSGREREIAVRSPDGRFLRLAANLTARSGPEERLRAWYRDARARSARPAAVAVSEAETERLRALGYLGP